ncbi:FCD domain-containing protein [Nakamurella sp. YIM 132087]|uniref:FCD domain-containing protein n=1 Tax=Nakamurella alba TaxID=2665158 RepID=A0A7K1FG69_9ACTN|nr:GntR family transcriptional regulator [Nakamurella alba]MTD13101.1 FCD domain-containing protein [Nakamurella alba]
MTVSDMSVGGLYAPSLVEVATRRLREEILSGHLEPGERLIEEQIRRRFEISRAPLREALRLLAQQGLIDHLPRRGARVAEWSETDIRQLFEIRDVLERFAIESAFPLHPEVAAPRLAVCEQALQEMRRADRSGDELAKDDAHRSFHAALVGLAGNRQLDLAIEPVLLKLQRPMAVNLRTEAALLGSEAGLRRHQDLLEAAVSNDAGVLLRTLAEHGSRRYLVAAVADQD